tara:strand:- start:23444 stop:23872 length:429 start_codon:yes stop_codon:yes gene_type:complete
MYFGNEKNERVFSYLNSHATKEAKQLQESFYTLLEDYFDNLTSEISKNKDHYQQLYHSTDNTWVYMSECGTKVVHVSAREDYDPFRGKPKDLVISLTSTDRGLQEKLDNVNNEELILTHRNLIKEVLKIKEDKNLKVVEVEE